MHYKQKNNSISSCWLSRQVSRFGFHSFHSELKLGTSLLQGRSKCKMQFQFAIKTIKTITTNTWQQQLLLLSSIFLHNFNRNRKKSPKIINNHQKNFEKRHINKNNEYVHIFDLIFVVFFSQMLRIFPFIHYLTHGNLDLSTQSKHLI